MARPLERALEYEEPGRLVVSRDGLRLADPRTTRGALARLAREALGDLRSERAAHLRACDDDECGALYLDPTGRRRWCSTAVCGNKHRVRDLRQRRRSSAGSS